MILTSLIVGGIIAAGVIGIIATFWDDILAFLKKALAKVKSIVKGIVYGAQVFMKKLKEGCQEIARYYSKVEDHWEETIVTKTISENQVPKEILERAERAAHEIDITDELELQLQNA